MRGAWRTLAANGEKRLRRGTALYSSAEEGLLTLVEKEAGRRAGDVELCSEGVCCGEPLLLVVSIESGIQAGS